MPVVATAGHVDHGKSTLVRALTDQDPDRLDEERRRGLSIELGYCWTDLAGVRDVAFVDVPGHERFLSTTLAGLGPAPAVMLVVAADDPWMPQAAEHLAAIDALGIRDGVLVVTRSDLADPALALARAVTEVGRTSLAGCAAVAVSGLTGAGLDDLRAALAEMLLAVEAPLDADVRLWVDRVFVVAGAGTVVTGTIPAGVVRRGDDLALDGELVRVRGLESLGREVPEVVGPARVALRLGGHPPDGLARGSALVTPGAFAEIREVDVRLRRADRLPGQPLLHVGSHRQIVQARPLGERHARLRLQHSLPLRQGDRLVLRDPGSRMLWGADVLDAEPPPLTRRGAARARADVLEDWRPGLGGHLARDGRAHVGRLRRLGVTGPVPEDATTLGEWLVSVEQLAEWRDALVAALTGRVSGLSPAAAARAIGLPDPTLVHAVVGGPIRWRAGRLVVESPLPDALTAALAVLHERLTAAPYAAPGAEELAALGLDRPVLARLGHDGRLLVLGDGVVLLPGADAAARDALAALPQPFSTSQARQALATSRRVVLPLLAHLDRAGLTVRLPDDTRRVIRNR